MEALIGNLAMGAMEGDSQLLIISIIAMALAAFGAFAVLTRPQETEVTPAYAFAGRIHYDARDASQNLEIGEDQMLHQMAADAREAADFNWPEQHGNRHALKTFCPYCGAEVFASEDHCPRCGGNFLA